MRTLAQLLGGAAVLAALAGCATFQDSTALTAQQEDLNILRAELNRATGRVETVEMENRRLAGEIENLRALAADTSQLAAVRERADKLERQLAELNAAREQDKQALVDQLSRRLEEIVAKLAPRSAGGGGEHVVQAGETLSGIAAAYQVRTSALLEANNISNADLLRVGQKLVIPR